MTFRLLLTFLVLPLSTGCTLVGGMVGATAPSTQSVEITALRQLAGGEKVEVTLASGERVVGRVHGYAPGGSAPAAAVSSTVGAGRPLLGDSIVVSTVSGQQVRCLLTGIRRDALAVGCSGMSLQVPYAAVSEVGWGDGHRRVGAALAEFARVADLPAEGWLVLSTAEGPRTLRFDEALHIRTVGRPGNVILGMAVGLAVDVLIARFAWSQFKPDFSGMWASQ
jgi:hypothetical protein